MSISGGTAVCGIVGDPIEHSLSPAMQNAAFAAAGLDFVYVAFRLPRGAARECAAAVRTLNLCGLNVTVPHKVEILPFLDAVDPGAARIGAVNTIVNAGGRLTGYNTDAVGFLQGIEAKGISLEGADVVVLGAGGAARAVVFSLVERGARVSVLNRDEARAKALANDVSASYGRPVAHCALGEQSLQSLLPGAALLVNTTSVGMHPLTDATPCPAALLRPGLAVCDIVYNPRSTLLLREAAGRGAATVDGVEMLVRQGAKAFELWTGIGAPVEVMRAVVVRELDRVAH
jgi:shikimate dehydrogenase